MYNMLTQVSRDTIPLDDFIDRNRNIYEGIGAHNIYVTIDNVHTVPERPGRRFVYYTMQMDTIAGEIAKALAGDFRVRLIYCSDKKGVLLNENDANSVIRSLTREDFLQYKEKGIIRDGMIPKLENAFAAIDSGVNEIILTCASHIHTGSGTYIY